MSQTGVIPGRASLREPGIQAAVRLAKFSGFWVRRLRGAPEQLRICFEQRNGQAWALAGDLVTRLN
jgi:hypothetical protein